MPRRAAQLLIVFACLMVVVVTMPDHPRPEPPQIVQPRGTPQIQWDVLERGIADQARWYTEAASHPAVVQLPPRRSGTARAAARGGESVYGSGACGGDLPPCSVMRCESGGSLTAHNASGADGKWQIMPRTWDTEDSDGDGVNDSYHGYDNPSNAPESVQDDRAREIYAGGAGRRQWAC